MRGSRLVPIALILIIIAIAIAALVSLGRAVFFSDGSSQTVSEVDVSRDALLSTAVDRSVKMTVRGEIVANEQFRSYEITVTPTSRTLVTYAGYLEQKIDEIVLDNNIPAYEEFVYALEKADLAAGAELTGEANDRRGLCATGQVYEFAVLKAGTSVKTLWTSTCKGIEGSLDASVTQLTSLFINQIPKGQALINKTNL
jgi:hypothetical protein